MSYRQFLIELCECFDGHPTSDQQGRLGLALVRTPGEVTAALADADLVEPPDFDPQGWPDTFNETYVRFTNRDRKFKEDSVAYRDRGNFQVTQAIRSQVLSRPWVTRAAVATKIAWAAGRAAAMPVVTGNLRVRRSKASGLTPGGLFKLTFSQNGIADLVARVESITHSAPDKPEVTISFREDRGFLNADLALPAGDAPSDDTPIETAPLSHQSIIELPYALLADNQVRLGVLAARGDSLSTGMNLWIQQASGAYVNFVQPFILQHELDLASATAIPVTLQHRVRRPLAPINLRVNGDGRTPTYGTGAGISVNWDRTDPRRAVQGPTAVLVLAIDRTVVELLTLGGVLKETFSFPATGPQTITNAQIVAALGAETDFVLRAWFESAGRRSLESDQITVRKV
jgi:hypothetical protein